MLVFIQKSTWLFLVCLLACSWVVPLASQAASVKRVAGLSVSGHVYNKANKPLAGVVITLQNAASFQSGASVTATNAEGAFFLNYSGEAPVLLFKYAGYQTQTLCIKAKGPVGITLYEVGTPLLPQAEGVEMVVEPIETPDVAPMYSGGAAAYQAYIRQNLRYPEAARAKGIQGTVLVSFVVDEQGRVLNPEVGRGVEGLNEEALRLAAAMPWWTPGRKNGKPVRSSTFLRIRFEYRDE